MRDRRRHIDYGTTRYAPKIARRLRVLNLATWMAAMLMAGFAASEFLVAPAGYWKVGTAHAVAAMLLGVVPLLHRFGQLAAPLAFAAIGYSVIYTNGVLVGADAGVAMQFLVAAAIMVVILGAEHPLIGAALAALAALLAIALEMTVPADTGVYPRAYVLASLVANVVGSSVILFAIMFYTVREAARAEAAAENEHQRTESLLASILPEAVAERLKLAPGSTVVDRYDEASVLFADMADFTARAGEVRPEDLVACLNRVFGEFDRLVARHGLEKIKTSGDAYMVVSGVPRPRPDHAEILADFAIEMRDMARTLPNSQGQPTTIRIGMASGPVVAGVIGKSKMFYDVWGDTVNMASRMESTGPRGQIQVSAASYELLRDKFDLDEVGLLEIKGKGPVAAWLLRKRKNPSAAGRSGRPRDALPGAS